MTDRPWEPGHWWIAPFLPLVYIIFNVIYWAAGGTNEVECVMKKEREKEINLSISVRFETATPV